MVFIEPNTLFLRKKRLYIPPSRLISALEGIKILHISDLHIKRIGKKEKKILRYIEELKPDLILITGDYLDYTPRLEIAVEFIGKLKARMGVFGNVGNVDYVYPVNVARLKKRCPENILLNEARQVFFKGQSLWIVGVGDPILYKTRSFFEKKIKDLLGSVPSDEPCVVLIHRPEQIPLVLSLGAELVLCGHTHGGQMRLPFSLQFYNQSEECKKYNKGIYHVDNSIVNVSAGVGTSDISMRFLCPPEISLLEIARKET